MFGLRRRQKKQPLRFNKQCVCGELISGLRSEGAQRKSCPQCGEQHSFLPISPYPIPRMPRGYVVQVPPESEKTKLQVDQDPEERKSPFKWLMSLKKEKKKPEEIDKIKVERNASLKKRMKSAFTPVRLLIAGCALILMLTSWFIYRQQQVSWAEGVYSTAVEQANDAYQQGDYGTAKSSFAEASKAALILGLDGQDAEAVQQFHREFSFLSNLGERSIYELFSDQKKHAINSPGWWTRSIQDRFSGEWLMLDVRGELVNKKEQKWIQVDCPVIGSQAILQLYIPLPENRPSLMTYPDGSVRLIAGARFKNCRMSKEKLNSWEIEFGDVLIWKNRGTLEICGLVSDDVEERNQIEKLLKIQMSQQPAEEENPPAGNDQEENNQQENSEEQNNPEETIPAAQASE